MGLLNRDALLKKEKLEVRKVELGKNVFVFVRQMTGRERDTFEKSLVEVTRDKKGNSIVEQRLEDFRAKLAVHTVCNEKGELLLQSTDYPILSQNMSAARLEEIINVAQELNKISEEDKEALVKNSKAGPAGNSTSDSVKS